NLSGGVMGRPYGYDLDLYRGEVNRGELFLNSRIKALILSAGVLFKVIFAMSAFVYLYAQAVR
ncbi:MAG: hypothetical protein WCJ10_01815, partial [Opitutaceae bacterium]